MAAIRGLKSAELPEQLQDLGDVFSEGREADAVDENLASHGIELKEGKESPFPPIYGMWQELEVLHDYLDAALHKGWVLPSQSPADAPVLSAPKKDESLRLFVDY